MEYTDQYLIEDLIIFKEYLGRIPSSRDMDLDGLTPSSKLYSKRFGTWNNALKKAGLSILRNSVNYSHKSDEFLISKLKTLKEELNRTPRRRDLAGIKGLPGRGVYERRFGSWDNALIKAGLKPNCNQSHITEENLALSYNKEWLLQQNETKTQYEISNDLGYNKHKMSGRFSELGITTKYHTGSLKEKEWLDSLGITERQYPIENYRVDGYDPETNTVYEFLGDYWHGNPEVYDPDEYNKSCSKTFGLLFDETNKRLEHIKSLGYNIITKWENDYENTV
jgi:hypothetical protein